MNSVAVAGEVAGASSDSEGTACADPQDGKREPSVGLGADRQRTAAQPSNRGLKRFQYPVVVRGSNPAEIEETDSKVLEVLTPESEHWRGLQLDPNH